MVISNLKGGLGNQMFEYAAGYVLAKKRQEDFKVDLTHLHNHKDFKNETPREFQLAFFNVDCKFSSKEEVIRIKKSYSKCIPFLIQLDEVLVMYNVIKYPLFTNISKDVYMNSYFQNEKYFSEYKNDIIEKFTLKKEFITKDFLKMKKLIEKERNSISIHIRRGDYITNKKANKWHGVLEEDYYHNAIEYLKNEKKMINSQIFLFSDDTAWVEENIDFGVKTYYMSEKFNPAQSIILMSKCKNNIIANSSFSWWGAWLNNNKNKVVIAPSKWLAHGDGPHKGIVPQNWIRLS